MLYEAQVARGQYFVHELTSEVNLAMKCVAKIMAVPGTSTVVVDLCMFGLAACDEGGPGFVNASVRTITNARRVGVRSKCTSTHRHAQTNENNAIEKGEQTGTWVRQVARAMEEQLREDQEGLETHEQKRKTEDAKRIRGIDHENNKNKGLIRVQNEKVNFMRHGEQELFSVWEGWHWDVNKGGWLDPKLCATARLEEVEYIRRQCTPGSPGKIADVRLEGHPSRQDGRRRTRDNTASPTCARGGSFWNFQDSLQARAVRVDAAARGAEGCAVGDAHG